MAEEKRPVPVEQARKFPPHWGAVPADLDERRSWIKAHVLADGPNAERTAAERESIEHQIVLLQRRYGPGEV